MHDGLKLHLLKKILKVLTCLLDRILPDTASRYPQEKIFESMFARLFNTYLLEVYSGRFDDVSRQSLKGLKDRNFQHFLSVTRKLLLFMSARDRYYRAWIGLGFVAAKEEYERALKSLRQEDFRANHLEMWEWCPLQVCDSYFEKNKSEFFEMMLTGHLSNLLRMRFASSRSPQGKENVGG